MRTDKERPEENTCRIVKGLDAVWAYFCPSKPCLSLSTDGNISITYNLTVLVNDLLIEPISAFRTRQRRCLCK